MWHLAEALLPGYSSLVWAVIALQAHRWGVKRVFAKRTSPWGAVRFRFLVGSLLGVVERESSMMSLRVGLNSI